MLCSGTQRSALRAARFSTRAAAGRPSRSTAASTSAPAEPLHLELLPPHPRSVRGASRLARRPTSLPAASGRAHNNAGSGAAVAVGHPTRGAQRPLHACSARTAAGGLGKEGWEAAGGKDGDEGCSVSSSDSSSGSDSSDDDCDDNEEAPGVGAAPSTTGVGDGSKEGGEARDGKGTTAATAAGDAIGSGQSKYRETITGGAGGAEGEGGEHDYRSIGSEIYEDGDLEAGEAMQGMYDFVDDIVETQHVPTIQDPFDHKGRFHRCPGKRQGKAALPSTCQIFDIKELHVNHTPLLKRFTNDAGMILGRYRTGLCAKCQRKVARTIKAARQMGFVPTVSDYEIRDTGPGGLFAWAGKDGDHDAMAKAKAKAEAARRKEEKRFGSLG